MPTIHTRYASLYQCCIMTLDFYLLILLCFLEMSTDDTHTEKPHWIYECPYIKSYRANDFQRNTLKYYTSDLVIQVINGYRDANSNCASGSFCKCLLCTPACAHLADPIQMFSQQGMLRHSALSYFPPNMEWSYRGQWRVTWAGHWVSPKTFRGIQIPLLTLECRERFSSPMHWP